MSNRSRRHTPASIRPHASSDPSEWSLRLHPGAVRWEPPYSCPDEQAHLVVLMHVADRLSHPSWNGTLRSLPEPDRWHSINSRGARGFHRHFDCGCVIEMVARS